MSYTEHCGMLTEEIFQPGFEDRFTATRCSGVQDDRCLKLFFDMYTARIVERYSLADGARIQNHCVGYPDDCNGLVKLEFMYLESHNTAAQAIFQSEMAAIRVDVDQRQAIAQQQAALRRQRRMQAIGAAATGVATHYENQAQQMQGPEKIKLRCRPGINGDDLKCEQE